MLPVEVPTAQASSSKITLPADNASPDLSTGSVFFIGNATVLIRYGGMTILTDPNFIHRHGQVPLGYGLDATRLRNPAIEIDELPPLDLIVLSHFHGDHFDQVAERNLNKSLPIVTTPEAAEELNERGFNNTRALKTWSSLTVEKGVVDLRVTSMPGRHGPPLSDLVLPEVMGSLLEFHSKAGTFQLYITGDTLVIDELKQISRRYPNVDLALLHLGGTRVLGIMLTMDGKQGVQMMQMVDPKYAIPIHYNDYDVMKSPLLDFKLEVKAAGLQDRVHYLDRGETYTFKPLSEHANSRHGVSNVHSGSALLHGLTSRPNSLARPRLSSVLWNHSEKRTRQDAP
jgi:L-ascorbate metabolism protein UlaG (beta-lactamase superfamily)